jgi:hypothetical protein
MFLSALFILSQADGYYVFETGCSYLAYTVVRQYLSKQGPADRDWQVVPQPGRELRDVGKL